MFEVMVAYYFAWGAVVMGPFSTDSQCERTRQWAARQHAPGRSVGVSECWYGPALSLAKPKDGR